MRRPREGGSRRRRAPGSVEAGVECADDGAGHWDAEVELAHHWNILREHRDLHTDNQPGNDFFWKYESLSC